MAEIPANKDDIVQEMATLITLLNRAGSRVVIAIDELDKLDTSNEETAHLFNAMKSLFTIQSCSFLLTISTSAWAEFEQRGLRRVPHGV